MLVGLDIGTTNVKAVAAGDDNTVLASAARLNRTRAPQPGFGEQDPEAVFQNVLAVLRKVAAAGTQRCAEPLRGVVFSSAMHGLLAVDESGEPLTNIWLWSDLRADAIARALRNSAEGMEIYRRTGVPLHAMSPLAKIIWLKQNLPGIFKKTHKFLGIKEFVWHRLTGHCESDLSLASATGLLDIRTNSWDGQALNLCGISPDRLPRPVLPSHIAHVNTSPSPENAFLSGVPLVIGASDGAFANTGSGAVHPGHFAVTIGTSAAIRTIIGTPETDARMRTFCYRVDESRCIAGGASNNGANALEWLRTQVFQSPLDTERFANLSSHAPPGCNGLLFLPYVQGERAPLYDAHATGAFSGLRTAHKQAHFVRAVMEGLLFNLKMIGEALEERHPIRLLYASGGFSHNALWVQMLADIFQKRVILTDETVDASVKGALQLGRSVLQLERIPDDQQKKEVEPDIRLALRYREHFERFKTFAQQAS